MVRDVGLGYYTITPQRFVSLSILRAMEHWGRYAVGPTDSADIVTYG